MIAIEVYTSAMRSWAHTFFIISATGMRLLTLTSIHHTPLYRTYYLSCSEVPVSPTYLQESCYFDVAMHSYTCGRWIWSISCGYSSSPFCVFKRWGNLIQSISAIPFYPHIASSSQSMSIVSVVLMLVCPVRGHSFVSESFYFLAWAIGPVQGFPQPGGPGHLFRVSIP